MISVALCVYNGEKFLKQQLESISTQTVLPDELIISDDASNDNSVQIVKEFSEANPAINCKLFLNGYNIGYIKNFEKAILNTSGDIIFLCDQDDVWQINKIERVQNILNDNKLAKGVFSNAFLINDRGEMIEGCLWDSIAFTEKKDLQQNNKQLFDYILKTFNVVTGACLAFKREAIIKLLPLNCIINELHDEYIALKLAARNELIALNEALIYYRVHNKQTHGVPEKSRWNAIGEIKEAKLKEFYKWNNSAKDVDRLWTYYKRMKFYQAPNNLYKDLLFSAQLQFEKFKTDYLKGLSFVQRKKTLFGWYSNDLYNTKWWEIILH